MRIVRETRDSFKLSKRTTSKKKRAGPFSLTKLICKMSKWIQRQVQKKSRTSRMKKMRTQRTWL